MIEQNKINEEFVEKVKLTSEEEKELDFGKNKPKVEEIITGEKDIFSPVFGTLLFQHPNLEYSVKGDAVLFSEKTRLLREGKLPTKKQLLTLLGKPTTYTCSCGAINSIGSGDWTESDDFKIQELEEKIDILIDDWNVLRTQYQEIQEKSDAFSGTDEEKVILENQMNTKLDEARVKFEELSKCRIDLTSLTFTKYNLVYGCVEEMSEQKKALFLSPHCILNKERKQIWKNEEEFITMKGKEGQEAGRVFGLFSLFLRGVDVSFFSKLLGGGSLE